MINVRYVLNILLLFAFSMLFLCSCGGDCEDANCKCKKSSDSGPVARFKYEPSSPSVNKKVQLDGSASSPGPDGGALSFEWEIIEKPDTSQSSISNPLSISPTFTPDKPGKYIIQLVVNDGKDKSSPLTITIIAKIEAPIAKVDVIEESVVNGSMKLDGSKSTPGSGGYPLEYNWAIILKPDGSKASLDYPDASSPKFVPDKPGLYRVKLIVNDGLSDSEPVITDLQTINSAPIAKADYIRPVRVSDTVKLDGSSSSDIDNDFLSYKWIMKSKPVKSNAQISNPYTPNPEFIADRPGIYIVQLIVNDGKLDSNPYTFSIATVNSKPVADAGENQVVFEGELVQLDGGNSKDIDENDLTYKWSIKERPKGSFAEITAPGKLDPTFIPDLPGKYIIQLVVNDGKVDSDPSFVEIIADPSIDLTPSIFSLNSVVTNTQTLAISGQVEVEIRNLGTRTVENEYNVMIFEDINNNEKYDSLDNILGKLTIPKETKYYKNYNNPKAPQGNDSIRVPVTVKGTVLFSGNLIYAFVDSDNKITEKNENNNIKSNMEDKTCPPPIEGYVPVLDWQWPPDDLSYERASIQVVCTPVIGNLSDDNGDFKIDEKDIPDIVFISFVGNDYEKNGVLRAISGDGTKSIFSVARVDTLANSYRPFPTYSPALADIDNDGIIDVLVIVKGKEDTKRLAVFDNKGELKWLSIDASSSQLTYPASINIADIDNNGLPEIIIGNIVITNSGATKWIGTSDDGLNNSIVADINLDRKLEIIAGRTVYDYSGKIVWRKSDSDLEDGFTGVANFDDDEFPEIVLVSKGKVSLLEHSGDIKWGPYEILPGGANRGHGGPPVITDVDGDGKPEIGVAGASRFILYDSDGHVLWAAKIYDPSAVTGAAAFDFDCDGKCEIVYRDHNYLRIFRGVDGTVISKEIPVESGTFIELPVIADVDNDNNAEIIVTSNSYISQGSPGIHVYKDANDYWVNTRKIWNQHAYCITNINDDGSVPKNPKNNWEVKGFNNFRQNQMVNPIQCSDISASYIRVENLNCMQSANLVVRIGNGGSLHIPPEIQVSFYRGNPALGGILLKTILTEERIYPGRFIDITYTMDNPGYGQHNIYVVVDEDNKIRENDEDNNLTMTSFSCQ